MPQMSPLSWLTLMITFILILSTFNIVNFFSFKYNIKKNLKMQIIKNQNNWKW